jgi:glycosyltransferase 2 family protein
MEPKALSRLHRFAPWIKYGIGILAFAALLKTGALDLHAVKNALRHSPEFIAIALGLYGVVNLLATTRWWFLLRHADIALTWLQVFRLHMIGVFFSALLPGGTAGDFAKGFYLFRKGDSQRSARAVASIVMDRILGLFGMALLAIAGAWSQVHLWENDVQLRSLEYLILLAALGILLVVLLAIFPDATWIRPLYAWMSRIPGGAFLSQTVQSLSIYRSRPWVLGVSLLITFVTHLNLVLTYWACSWALGSDTGLDLHLVVAPLCTMLNGIPISPAGLGVGEAFGDWIYGRLGYGLGSEVLALVHLCVFLTAALFSVAYFFQKRH